MCSSLRDFWARNGGKGFKEEDKLQGKRKKRF